VLGPLEVLVQGQPIQLGGLKQRCILAMLLLDANKVVSAENLYSSLWNEELSEKGRGVLQVHVSTLRKALAPAAVALGRQELIATKSPGYQIALGEAKLDLHVFEANVKQARSAYVGGDPSSASTWYSEALALWKGTPLGDIRPEYFAQRESKRLEGRRVQALAGQLEADLAAGRHQQIIPELQALVEDHPFNEQFAGLLMISLYRSGRQSDALTVFQFCRQQLQSEHGLDPRPNLRDLQSRILSQDPSLDLAPAEEPDLSVPTLMPSSVPLFRGALTMNGERIELVEKLTTLGRKENRNVPILDPQASRDHAEILRESYGYRLIDRDSSNGTKVNGEPIREIVLQDGDEILIGETVLSFSLIV
jgi:serine/threonine-protein kinase PknK